VAVPDRAVGYQSMMSEEGKQSATPAPAPASNMDTKSESTASPPTGQGVSSVSPPVSTVTQPAPPATEDEEEESEDESEILEESPCGRWQKRREEVYSKSFYSFVCRMDQNFVGSKVIIHCKYSHLLNDDNLNFRVYCLNIILI